MNEVRGLPSEELEIARGKASRRTSCMGLRNRVGNVLGDIREGMVKSCHCILSMIGGLY